MPGVYQQTSFENIILTILAIVVIMVIVGCIYTFIRAIFFFIFGGHKEENKKKGRNAIRFMIIGIILTVILLFIFPSVFRLMSIPGYEKYTPKNIFNRAGEIINIGFQLGNFIEESQKENQFRGNLYYDTTPDGGVAPDTSTDTQTSVYDL